MTERIGELAVELTPKRIAHRMANISASRNGTIPQALRVGDIDLENRRRSTDRCGRQIPASGNSLATWKSLPASRMATAISFPPGKGTLPISSAPKAC